MINLLLAIIYLAFISLGLPDSLLGAAWPSMHGALDVPVSYAGIVSMLIALGTIISSLASDRLVRALGTGRVMVFSVATTACALLGFSISGSFAALCVWAIPYGLGAGSVDASLNNYVALHYESRHMSWLHCMWGVGATLGPYIMGRVLTGGGVWTQGYRYVGFMQLALTAILVAGLPLWKRNAAVGEKDASSGAALSLRQVLRLPGAGEVMLCFFIYCALEQSAGLWAGSYLMLHRGVSAETAAACAGAFFAGITVGRALSGFISMRLNDVKLMRLGLAVVLAGALLLLLPLPVGVSIVGLVLTGVGCAPIYPSLIHSTPARFGAEASQAVIGVQMASAYVGTCLMPPLFGLLSSSISIALLPAYLLALLLLLIWFSESLNRKTL